MFFKDQRAVDEYLSSKYATGEKPVAKRKQLLSFLSENGLTPSQVGILRSSDRETKWEGGLPKRFWFDVGSTRVYIPIKYANTDDQANFVGFQDAEGNAVSLEQVQIVTFETTRQLEKPVEVNGEEMHFEVSLDNQCIPTSVETAGSLG